MKSLAFILSLLVAGTAASTVLAQNYHHYQGPTCAQLYRAGYDANVDWPKHFVPPARRAVCDTYAVMIENGWRRQNLIGNYHFDQDSNELTQAGKLKVRWILTQAPVERRNVFVERGMSQAETANRIASVQDWASSVHTDHGMVSVSDTHIVSEGHSAHVVDSIFVGFHEHRHAPKLMEASQGGGGVGQ